MSNVRPVPEGFHTMTPYLLVPEGEAAVDFYRRAFDATAVSVIKDPSGRLVHALLRIGDSFLMMGEAHNLDVRGDKTYPRVSLYLYVEDVDAWAARAEAAGAKVIMPVTNQFYGDRSGGFEDPYGIVWWISTHIEDMSDEELMRRSAAARSGQQSTSGS